MVGKQAWWGEAGPGDEDEFGKAENEILGCPNGGASPDIIRSREMEPACIDFGSAVEYGVFEGFISLLTVWACLGGISVIPGSMGSEAAFTRPHLVEAASCEPVQAHKQVGL